MSKTNTTQTRSSGRPRRGGWSGSYQVLGRTQLEPEEQAEAERQLAALEEAPDAPVSTALRWRKPQLDLVRRAARLAGVPYQAYLKQAAIKCAIEDLRAAREAGVQLE
jgi:hypothetical protein